MDGIITEERLMSLAGLSQRAALRRHLKKAGIPFKVLNGTIFTTEEALTAALAGRAQKTRGPNLDALTAKSTG